MLVEVGAIAVQVAESAGVDKRAVWEAWAPIGARVLLRRADVEPVLMDVLQVWRGVRARCSAVEQGGTHACPACLLEAAASTAARLACYRLVDRADVVALWRAVGFEDADVIVGRLVPELN